MCALGICQGGKEAALDAAAVEWSTAMGRSSAVARSSTSENDRLERKTWTDVPPDSSTDGGRIGPRLWVAAAERSFMACHIN